VVVVEEEEEEMKEVKAVEDQVVQKMEVVTRGQQRAFERFEERGVCPHQARLTLRLRYSGKRSLRGRAELVLALALLDYLQVVVVVVVEEEEKMAACWKQTTEASKHQRCRLY